jgi:hypothetical protein
MNLDARVFDALPAPPRELTIAQLAADLKLANKQVVAALHRLRNKGAAGNNGRRGPASAWSRAGVNGAPPGAAAGAPSQVPVVAAAAPDFQAAIDHRGRIAVRVDGIGIQIRPADALELLAFLQQMEDVIAYQANPEGAKK